MSHSEVALTDGKLYNFVRNFLYYSWLTEPNFYDFFASESSFIAGFGVECPGWDRFGVPSSAISNNCRRAVSIIRGCPCRVPYVENRPMV